MLRKGGPHGMSEMAATAIVWILQIYLLCGIVFAAAFALSGVRRIDPAAVEGTWGFRLLIVPGAVALWPLLLGRWLRQAPPPEERNAHRIAARERRR